MSTARASRGGGVHRAGAPLPTPHSTSRAPRAALRSTSSTRGRCRGRPTDGPRAFLAAAGAAPSAPQRLWGWRSGAATAALPTRTPTRGARGRDHPPPLWTWLPPPAPLPRPPSPPPVCLLHPHRSLCQSRCGGRGAAQQQSLRRSCDRDVAGSSGVGMVVVTQKPPHVRRPCHNRTEGGRAGAKAQQHRPRHPQSTIMERRCPPDAYPAVLVGLAGGWYVPGR